MRFRPAAALVLAPAVAICACAAVGTAGTPTPNTTRAGSSILTATALHGPATSDPAPSGPATVTPTGSSPATSTSTLTVTTTVATTSTTTPSGTPPATDLSGEVYGFLTAVDPARSEVTLDKIDWFTGAAAQQACAEDGVTGTDNNRCIGWYYRNKNPALRVVAVAPDAAISTLNGGTHGVPGDLVAVAAQLAGTGDRAPWRLVVTDGRVTELQQVYLP
jgi:hypothetical protein